MFADVPPQGTVPQRHSHIPQDRILNKTTAATTSLSQISYAVNYQRCFSASGATISPAHAQAHRVSLAGGVSKHCGDTQALLFGDPGLDTKPSEVCLGYSQSRPSLHMQHTSSGYGVESAGQRFFCSLEPRDRLCGPHNLLLSGERGPFIGVKSA